MIDGIKAACIGVNPSSWVNNPLLDFDLTVSESTGEILKRKKEATRHGLTFRISPQQTGDGFCSILGSLHRYKNDGGCNADNFTFADLQNILPDLRDTFLIPLETANITRLEVGVNICLPFSPDIIIKNAIAHSGRGYYPISGERGRIGVECVYTDYKIKFYNKSKQTGQPGNILRIEFVAKRQRVLEPYGIRTLADLADREKVFSLISLLVKAINNTVFYDSEFKGKGITPAAFDRFQHYRDTKFWEELNPSKLKYHRKRYKELLHKYGLHDWREYCLFKVVETWCKLFDLQAEKLPRFPQIFETLQADEITTFSTFNCLLENVVNEPREFTTFKERKKEPEKPLITPPPETPILPRRFCVVCGREITHQREGSRFCSEQIYGKVARRCRNKDSNRRLLLKRKIKRAMSKNLFLRITYQDNGTRYTDILAASEICLTREWLDRVVCVATLHDPTQVLTDKEARKYLQEVEAKERGLQNEQC